MAVGPLNRIEASCGSKLKLDIVDKLAETAQSTCAWRSDRYQTNESRSGSCGHSEASIVHRGRLERVRVLVLSEFAPGVSDWIAISDLTPIVND